MENKQLQEIIDTHKNLSNKELANVLITISHDFDNIKSVILNLTTTLSELEITYDTIYNELQSRLKFEDSNGG